jgi:hypothetical protein
MTREGPGVKSRPRLRLMTAKMTAKPADLCTVPGLVEWSGNRRMAAGRHL